MYREDINCLRGFSILFILFYHFFPEIFGGGFITVDILFCISGYLINTSLTSAKYSSYILFIAKRIKRLIPSQTVVMLAILIYYYNLNPIDFKELSNECNMTLLFVLNYYYRWRNMDYLSADKGSFQSPIVHFWTLSIEFQFYIVSPLLASYITYNRYTIIIIYICIVYYSYYSTIYNHSNSYFSSIIRLLDFLTGICAAQNNQYDYKYFKYLLFGIIIIASLTTNYIIYYPGIIIVIPIFFSYTFLSSMRYNKFILFKLLDYIGTYSYSLYLVHYPLGFCKEKYISILFSFAFSYILFNLVEKKSDKIISENRNTIFYYIFYVIQFYLFMNILCHVKYSQNKKHLFNSVWGYISKYKSKCFLAYKDYKIISKKAYILLLGDSHIQHFFPAINYYLLKNNFAAYGVTFWINRIINNDYLILIQIFNKINTPVLTLISFRLSKWSFLKNISLLYIKFMNFIKLVKKYSKNVIYIEETPFHNYNPHKLYFAKNNRFCIININCSVIDFQFITSMNVSIFSIRSLICLNDKCPDSVNNTLIYEDNNHITLEFSLSLKYIFYRILHQYLKHYKSQYVYSECVITQNNLFTRMKDLLKYK